MFTLKKADKLTKNKSFQAVYKGGKSVSNRLLVLYILPNQSSERRIGFAAGKRLGNAVVRNRIKRMMREAYRLHRADLPEGHDFILVGRQPAVGVKSQEIVSAFLHLCGRLQKQNSGK